MTPPRAVRAAVRGEPGETCWLRTPQLGWRPGIFLKSIYIRIRIEGHSTTYTLDIIDLTDTKILRPRDPSLNGADRPREKK
jgi:hypothetical protein